MRTPHLAFLVIAAPIAVLITVSFTGAADDPDALPYSLTAVGVTNDPGPPAPPALPERVDVGQPKGIYLEAASITNDIGIEKRHTIQVNGREQFDVPASPRNIAWYDRFGDLGNTGSNAIFAAHVDHVGLGRAPFYFLAGTPKGEAVHVTTSKGERLSYTVSSVEVIHLDDIDMNEVVYPELEEGRERITLISCGGTFVPNLNGPGGQYDSRVILTAERTVQ